MFTIHRPRSGSSSVINPSYQPPYSQQSLWQLLKTSGGRYYLVRCLLYMDGLRSLLFSIFKFLFSNEPPPYIESEDQLPPSQFHPPIQQPAPLNEESDPRAQIIIGVSSSKTENRHCRDMESFQTVSDYVSKNEDKFVSHSYNDHQDGYSVKAYNFPISHSGCCLSRFFSQPHEIIDLHYSNTQNLFTISYRKDIGESFKRVAELAKAQGFDQLDITLIKVDSLRAKARQQIEAEGLTVIDRTPTLKQVEGLQPTAPEWTPCQWTPQQSMY